MDVPADVVPAMVHGVRFLVILASILNFFASLGFVYVIFAEMKSKNKEKSGNFESSRKTGQYRMNNLSSGLLLVSGILTIVAATWWGFNASGSGGSGLKSGGGFASMNSLQGFSGIAQWSKNKKSGKC